MTFLRTFLFLTVFSFGLSRAQTDGATFESLFEVSAPAASSAVETTEPAAAPAEAVSDAPAAEPQVEEPVVVAPPSFVVVLPERLDDQWYWYYGAVQSQHIVQSEVEKRLVRAGLTVVDAATLQASVGSLTVEGLMQGNASRDVARTAGATYLVLGQATAAKASHDKAYGVTVIRSSAEITAKIVRVADGQILDVFDSSALEGGQAALTAGREALKAAAKPLAKDVAAACVKLVQ